MDGIANPITLPELPLVDNPEQGSDPVEPSLLSPDNEGENLFTCPGVAFALGMAMIPLRKRFWLWGDKRLGKDPANKS
jgi:hypothetical protein